MAAATRTEPWVATGSDNLTSLTELNERTLLASLKERYTRDLVYTDVGDILVAINPFRALPLYDKRWAGAYALPDVSGLAPHIFKVAARAYNSLVQAKRDQVCVISGESGAGKTESAKFVIRQAMDMCVSAGAGHNIQQKIVELNPLLEAFGNARTALNDNSSRFGKFIQLIFQPNGRIVGAGLDQYLLEKSRVCVQGDKERNFHIFYFLFAGLTDEERRQLHLKNPSDHRYLNSYKNLIADCSSMEYRAAYAAVLESMRKVEFREEEISDVRILLAAVLLIGDIEFEGDKDKAAVKSKDVLTSLGALLQLNDTAELGASLTTLQSTTRGETVVKYYSPAKAGDVRDALAKALYSRMFYWIVMKINLCLQPEPSDEHLHIGILDIFGFENFAINSFEQLCINLANEQLQQYFNHQIFAMEKVEYAKEGLKDLEISFNDNTSVLNLFLVKPGGLLSLLDEQCKGVNGTDQAFVQRCKDHFKKHPNFTPHRGDGLEFTVKHFASSVRYEAAGFLDKNKDSLPEGVVSAIMGAGVKLVTLVMGKGFKTTRSQLKTSVHMKPSQRKSMRLMSHSRRATLTKQGRGGGKFLSVGSYFRESLELLMERIFAATPHFVRCIKPNQSKSPDNFDDDYSILQLRYTGMLEAVRVRKEGFSYRPFFSDFCDAYKCLAYDFTDKTSHPSEATCQVILRRAGIEGWRLGHARVFLRYYHQERLLLLLKEQEDKALILQKVFRGQQTRKWTKPMRETQKRENAQVCAFLQSIEPNVELCFQRILALNKTDIMQAVARFGNNNEEYLEELEAKGRGRMGTKSSPVLGGRSPEEEGEEEEEEGEEEEEEGEEEEEEEEEKEGKVEGIEMSKQEERCELSFTAIDLENKCPKTMSSPDSQLFSDIADSLEQAGFQRGSQTNPLNCGDDTRDDNDVGVATTGSTPISTRLDTDLGGIKYSTPLAPLPSKLRPKAPRRLKATPSNSTSSSPAPTGTPSNLNNPLGGIHFFAPLAPLPSKGRPTPARRLKTGGSFELLPRGSPDHLSHSANASQQNSPRVSILVADDDDNSGDPRGAVGGAPRYPVATEVPLRPHSAPLSRLPHDRAPTPPVPPSRPSSRPPSRPPSQLSSNNPLDQPSGSQTSSGPPTRPSSRPPSQLSNGLPFADKPPGGDGPLPSRPHSRPPSVASIAETPFLPPADNPAHNVTTPPSSAPSRLQHLSPPLSTGIPPLTTASPQGASSLLPDPTHQETALLSWQQKQATPLPSTRTPPSVFSPLLVDHTMPTTLGHLTADHTQPDTPTTSPSAPGPREKRKENMISPRGSNPQTSELHNTGNHTPEPSRKWAPTPGLNSAGAQNPEPSRKGVPTHGLNSAGAQTPEPSRKGAPTPGLNSAGAQTPKPSRKGALTPGLNSAGAQTPEPSRKGAPTPGLNSAGAQTPEPSRKGVPTPGLNSAGAQTPSGSPILSRPPASPVDRRSLGSMESVLNGEPVPSNAHLNDKRRTSTPNGEVSSSKGIFERFKALRNRVSSSTSSSEYSVPGLYLHLAEDEATVMVTGEPKGTYVLCSSNGGRLLVSPNVVYTLLVSEGQSNRVHQLSIIKADGGKKLCVENATPLVKLPDLESLLQHYKRADLLSNMRLSQPLLTTMRGPRQPATPKESPPLRWMERVKE